MKRRDFLNRSIAAAALVTAAGSAVSSAVSAQDTASADADYVPRPDFPYKKIKIAQIGVRHEHAPGKMNSLKMLPEYFDIAGIAAESPEEEQRHKNDGVYAGLTWYSQDDLLNIPGLEAVAVETEMTELLPTAVRCAEKKLHLHVDKPLGQDLDECRKMLGICRENGVIMQPGYMFRTNPAIRLAIRAVHEGWLGDVLDVSANMDRTDTDPGFRKWLAGYRGGGMYDFGSHLVDFVVEMLGAPKDVHVFEKPSIDDGLSDHTLSILLYDRAIVRLRVNERAVDGFSHRELTVSGTKGKLTLYPLEKWTNDPATGKLPRLNLTMTLTEDNGEYKAGTHHLKLAPYEDRYIGQLIDFAQYIRGVKENPYTYEEELLVQEVILAASGYIPWKER